MNKSKLDMEKVGGRVKELRESLGLTQKELADKINVGEQIINDFEKGLIRNGFELLINLIQSLNTTADYIFFLKD